MQIVIRWHEPSFDKCTLSFIVINFLSFKKKEHAYGMIGPHVEDLEMPNSTTAHP